MKTSILTGAVFLSLALASLGSAPAALAGGPKDCPPGLAKKGSCTPPGHRKQWHKGDRIPDDVQVRVIHDHDRYRVRRPRQGEVYVEIGGDIYLIAEATKRVIEAINLVDAATK
tara:strand:+ start:312 stop:653 length:342 start_codon:yes stop_codon:yes gene_type:complete